MARRKSLKVETAETLEELNQKLTALTEEYDLNTHQIEVFSTSLISGYNFWFIEVWKL